MTSNPFEDADATYHVLLNGEEQYSLWPAFVEVPEGWRRVLSDVGRQEALDYINENWTDMRPKSLIDAMEEAES